MIEGGAEQRAALQAARELSGQLLHSSHRRYLRHVLLQHFKVFEQQNTLVFERRLKRLATVHHVFDLPEDPRIGHRATSNEHAVTASLAKTIECLLNRRHVAAS